MSGLFDALSPWSLFVATVLLVLVAVEVGYRLGSFRRGAAEHEKEAPVGAMVGATLGLLAFLLAFTFGFAANLYQSKREVLLEEANAVGTAYLRAGFLAEAETARRLFREYVDVRLAAAQTGQVDTAIDRSEQIQTELWALASEDARENPSALPVALFVEALNSVIDVHAKRVMIALRTRIPPAIWAALYTIAFFAFGTLGYHSGLSAANRSFAVLAVALIFSSVIWLIKDLDTSQQGALRVSQQAMVDLRNSMNGP
jgi:hypothetical protein